MTKRLCVTLENTAATDAVRSVATRAWFVHRRVYGRRYMYAAARASELVAIHTPWYTMASIAYQYCRRTTVTTRQRRYGVSMKAWLLDSRCLLIGELSYMRLFMK
jgi:hypothetical protein